ncbi:glycosyltransferase [Rhodoferax sp.]|uniref:glycosyltransferase n=1 Tax=Rhodoferax sp. TaxID=50421 RepID=UPI00275EEEB2|nr:glycosyltransferase [Rhodoferax sp.]
MSVSVVSHGHGALVEVLLRELATHCAEEVSQVLLTLNLAEPALQHFVASTDWPFQITVLENRAPRSFSSNHNQAFARVSTPLFCVMNPDLRLGCNPFPALRSALSEARAGCAYPVQLDENAQRQDFERALPTPLSLFRRVCLGRKQSDGADWVNGAFMLFKAEVYRGLGGFDERYRLYCEDVDICIRLQLQGYRLRCAQVDVVHLAQRATGRRLRHLIWHVQSMFRLWCSAPYWRFLYR